MKKTYYGTEHIVCPNCGGEDDISFNVRTVECDCGYKYIGRGQWLSLENKVQDENYEK